MPPQQQNPYEFITNPAAPTTQLPGAAKGSQKKRIIYVAIGAVVLIILAVVFNSIISNANSGTTKAFTKVVQDQDELAHIASQSTQQAIQQVAKNVGATVKPSMDSYNQELVTLLGKEGLTLKDDKIKLGESTAIDNQLKNATTVSNFDSVFLSIMKDQLTAYQLDLVAASRANPTAADKKLLTKEYSGSKLLLTQVTESQASLSH